MIKDAYPLIHSKDNKAYQFKSIGKNGIIRKIILFQAIGHNKYNLAFGDWKGNDLDDKTISNNGDIIKVISTVAQSGYLFFEKYPTAIVEIEGVDKKRQQLYNHIFRRRKKELEELFIVSGKFGDTFESLQAGRFYKKFVIQKKKR